MSRTKPNNREQDELARPCGDCGARRGEWCITKTGRWSGLLHADRFYRAKAARERVSA